MRRLAVCLALAALAGCKRGADDAASTRRGPRFDVLGAIPHPSFARLNDTNGTADAQKLEYGTLISVDSLHRFYQHAFDSLGWRVENDQGDSLTATIVAAKDSQSVWVRIWRDPPGVRFTLVGSVAKPAQP